MNIIINIIIVIIINIIVAVITYVILLRRIGLKFNRNLVLDDGTKVEDNGEEIPPSSELPFEGRVLATFYAVDLVMPFRTCYYELISVYLFKWELVGIVKTELVTDFEQRLIFNEDVIPTSVLELELYELLKHNKLTGSSYEDKKLLSGWGKRVLAAGEIELLETKDVALGKSGRIRFTKQGYDKLLSHVSFEKYFMNLSFTTFDKMDHQRQKEEISFALLLSLTEEIEEFVNSNLKVPEMLQVANRVWRF